MATKKGPDRCINNGAASKVVLDRTPSVSGFAYATKNRPRNDAICGACREAVNGTMAARLEAAALTHRIHKHNIRIRRGPSPDYWLVSIEGVCTDTPMRDRKLRNYRKFCNAITHRFGVDFNWMPQADWSAIVEAAIAEGGAS